MFNQYVINLEIKDYVIRYTRFDISKKKVVSLGEHPIPNGVVRSGIIENEEELIKILMICAKKWRLKNKKVRFTMPDPLVIVRRQNIPNGVNIGDLRHYVNFHLGETIHLPFDKPSYDVVLIEEGIDDDHEVTIIATDELIVNKYQEIFKKVGMKLIAVDISSLNYYRLLHKQNLVDKADHVLLIHYDVNEVVFTAFRKNCPLLLQHFHLNSSNELTSFGTTFSRGDFNLDDVLAEFEEISLEIERVERFYQFSMNKNEDRFSKIAVVGDHPYLDEIVDRMLENNQQTVVTLNEEKVLGPKQMIVEPKYYNVYGLALKEVR